MGGFRSLADDEEVEFKADKSNKGWEAVEVRGCEGSDCRGSHRRPGAKKKLKKVRSVKQTLSQAHRLTKNLLESAKVRSF